MRWWKREGMIALTILVCIHSRLCGQCAVQQGDVLLARQLHLLAVNCSREKSRG